MSHTDHDRARVLAPLLEAVSVDGGINPLLAADEAAAVGSETVATELTGLDASEGGEVGQVILFTTRIPQHFQAAFTAVLRATWEVTSAADAGATARLIGRLLKTPPRGHGDLEVFDVQGPIVAIDALETFTHRLRDDIDALLFPQGTWRRGDLLTLVVTWEVVSNDGGTFDVSLRHDPDTADDRLLCYLGIGS